MFLVPSVEFRMQELLQGSNNEYRQTFDKKIYAKNEKRKSRFDEDVCEAGSYPRE
jgi:hypothetical protein